MTMKNNDVYYMQLIKKKHLSKEKLTKEEESFINSYKEKMIKKEMNPDYNPEVKKDLKKLKDLNDLVDSM